MASLTSHRLCLSLSPQLFTGHKKQPVIVPMYAASLVSGAQLQPSVCVMLVYFNHPPECV